MDILLTSFAWSVLYVMDPRLKNSVHNLRYGPRAWLIRGIYCSVSVRCLLGTNSSDVTERQPRYAQDDVGPSNGVRANPPCRKIKICREYRLLSSSKVGVKKPRRDILHV